MTVDIFGVTPHPFDRFKQLIDESIGRSLMIAFMSTKWEGTVYRVTAPGVTAVGRYQDGNVTVGLTISFPATYLKGQILEDIERAMRDAGCSGVRSTPS